MSIFDIPEKMWDRSIAVLILLFICAVVWRLLPWIRDALNDLKKSNITNTKVNAHLAVTNRSLSRHVGDVAKSVGHKGAALRHLCEAAKEAAAIEGPCQEAMQKALPHINMAIEELKQLPSR